MHRKAHPPEREADLNIVPYLDIVVNLVMFMLVSMSGFVMFQMVNANMPEIAKDRGDVPPPADKLTVTVGISTRGFFIDTTGAAIPAIPLKPNGAGVPDYDYDALTSQMVEIHRQHPDVTNYLMTADKSVKYDVIIRTMDATRGGHGNATLFPDVSFAATL